MTRRGPSAAWRAFHGGAPCLEVRCPECFAPVTPADLDLRSSRATCPECAKSFAVEVPEGWVPVPTGWTRGGTDAPIDGSPFRDRPQRPGLALGFRSWRWSVGVFLVLVWCFAATGLVRSNFAAAPPCECPEPSDPFFEGLRLLFVAWALLAPIGFGVWRYLERADFVIDADALRCRFRPGRTAETCWSTRSIQRFDVEKAGDATSPRFAARVWIDDEAHTLAVFGAEHDAAFLAHELRHAHARLVSD
ncbi:MAG: hypothetical protein H6721_07755 [Sandaracinus sp.]|nr:hypothetical protein [Myxococcales bacterium]MCB9598839.1 hypothetical protein [Sandaracinus sp.]MCB9613696.1 hypothetical protein [Sandaracinus sp.]MCB9632014.1 hypothetical protein [Sandaracinus sp.]